MKQFIIFHTRNYTEMYSSAFSAVQSANLHKKSKEEEITMKEYSTPKLDIVEIGKTDIIVTSDTKTGETNMTATGNQNYQSNDNFFNAWKGTT